MNIEVMLEILILIGMGLVAWYFVCKYLFSTGIGGRDDETIPIFIGGIVLFVILAIVVYLVMRLLYV